MTRKAVIPRARACGDVDAAIEQYRIEAGAEVALAFIDALEAGYAFIGATPAAGSPRRSHELDVPGLRTVRLKGFPWLIFYMELAGHVDVWRVLHAKRDIPLWMSETVE